MSQEETKSQPPLLLASFDLETTGLSVYSSEITQFGCAFERLLADCTVERLEPFCTLVDPQVEVICDAVVRVTGLTKEKLKGSPRVDIVLQAFAQHMDNIANDDDDRILLAYNGNAFDIPIMVAEAYRTLGMENTTCFFRSPVSYTHLTLPTKRIV